MDLDRSFGFLVNDVARLFGRRFSHNGRRLGLTRAQCRTLARISRHEGINQAGLADLLEVRPMTLVRQIDRMEDAGWIEQSALFTRALSALSAEDGLLRAALLRAARCERRALEETGALLADDPANGRALELYGELVARRKLGLTEYPMPAVDWSSVKRAR